MGIFQRSAVIRQVIPGTNKIAAASSKTVFLLAEKGASLLFRKARSGESSIRLNYVPKHGLVLAGDYGGMVSAYSESGECVWNVQRRVALDSFVRVDASDAVVLKGDVCDAFDLGRGKWLDVDLRHVAGPLSTGGGMVYYRQGELEYREKIDASGVRLELGPGGSPRIATEAGPFLLIAQFDHQNLSVYDRQRGGRAVSEVVLPDCQLISDLRSSADGESVIVVGFPTGGNSIAIWRWRLEGPAEMQRCNDVKPQVFALSEQADYACSTAGCVIVTGSGEVLQKSWPQKLRDC